MSRYMDQPTMERNFMDAFSEYGDAIFRFSMVKVSNVQLAEDMTQEVFMRYWQCLKDGRRMTNTRSFLYTIANNLAKDWYKRKKAESLDLHMESGFSPRDETPDPEAHASYLEILTAIDDLEERDKEVLLLCYVEGLPPRDVSELLNETPNNISVRLNRAVSRLQKKLGI